MKIINFQPATAWGTASRPQWEAAALRLEKCKVTRAISARLHGLREARKEVVCHFLGSTVDQTLPQLRQLAANLCLDVVFEYSAVFMVEQRDGPVPPYRNECAGAGRIECAAP